MMKQHIAVLCSLLLILSGCGKGSDAAKALLCSDGHAKGLVTLGLNLDFFSNLGLAESSGLVSDEALKEYLNDTLDTAGVSSSALNVSNISSVTKGDKYRFLELGGSFGSGFGVATGLIKDAFASMGLRASSAFDFINESFAVAASPYTIVQTPYKDQWAFKQTNYNETLALIEKIRAKTGSNNDPVVVAVLDTGVNGEHPDLKDIMIEGADFTGEGGTSDDNGHGTHCAGIIAGQAKSADGVLGVAASANIKIMPIKVLGKKGGGDFQAIEKGVRYATEHGADVISMSLGAGLEYSDLKKQNTPLKNAIFEEAINKGIIVVVAAGNESCPLGGECKQSSLIFSKTFNEYTVVPCAYEGAICVGASNADETLASYSNYSSQKTDSNYRTHPDISAPGTNIYSTWIDESGDGKSGNASYKTISGTSMATPFVAGMAALFKWADRSITQDKFLELINASSAKPSDIVEKSGSGRADLYMATVALANDKAVSDAPTLSHPAPKPVEDPAGGEGSNDGDALISSLWGAICQ